MIEHMVSFGRETQTNCGVGLHTRFVKRLFDIHFSLLAQITVAQIMSIPAVFLRLRGGRQPSRFP